MRRNLLVDVLLQCYFGCFIVKLESEMGRHSYLRLFPLRKIQGIDYSKPTSS